MPASTRHPFRFGVQLRDAASRRELVELARKLEDLGFATASLPDHFDDQLAPVPALMAIAGATTDLRIGALVFDNDYRHPVVLAKELATLDLLSDGRLEIGLGAGWMRSDYDAAGIGYDAPGVRIDRFLEGLAIIKGLHGDGPYSFSGEHYEITALDGYPKPLQRPHPPVLIGGGGPRMLRLAARHADIVGINATMTGGAIDQQTIATMTDAAVTERVALVRDAAGDRDYELNIRVFFSRISDTPAQLFAEVGAMFGVPADDIANSPFALVGSTAAIADTLRERRARLGFSYIIIGPESVDELAPVVAALAGT